MINDLIIFCGKYLPYVIGLVFAVVVLWPRPRVRMAIAALVSAGIARLVLKPAIVHFIHRARPYIANPNIHNLIGPQTGEEYQSFPSGHALFFFALAMAIYRYDRRLGWWFFAGALLMGLGRVAGGIHYSTDIIGGAILGILVAEAVTRLVPVLRPQALEKAS